MNTSHASQDLLRLSRLAVLIGALFSSTAYATSFEIVDGQTEPIQKTLGDNETGVIQTGGALSTVNTAIAVSGANSMVINNGSLSTTGNSGYGISSSGANATITNNGSLSTTGNYGYGIFSSGTNATITNSGSISTTGNTLAGIASDNANVTVTNSGRIATTGNLGYGIYSSGANATITNSGSISTAGHLSSGIYSKGAGATILNSGSISTTGLNGYGILADAANATITNSGSISTTGAGAYGICVGGSGNNTLNVSGSIVASGASTRAIGGGAGDETLNIYSGARIIGTIDLGAGTNIVNVLTNGAGASSTMTLTHVGTINTSGSGLSFVNGNTVTSIDTSAIAASQASLGMLSSSIFQSIGQQLNQSPGLHRSVKVASNGSNAGLWADDTQPMGWGRVFGKYTSQDSHGTTMGFTDRSYGAIGGFEQTIGEHRAGIFGGVSQSNTNLEGNAGDVDSNGVFGGVYGQFAKEQWRFNGSLGLGYANYDSTREVTDNVYGVEQAKSTYHGWYLSPSVSAMRIFEREAGFSWRPSGELNYTYARLGSYGESGTTRSNLSVGSRDAEVLNARLQLAAHQMLGEKQGEVEFRGGVSYTHYGDDTTTMTLQGVGSTHYTLAGAGDVTGGYVGFNGRYYYRDNVKLVGDIEVFNAGQKDYSVMAYAGLEYRF